MIERRRWPRHEVAWFVKLIIGDRDVIAAKATNASQHGLRLEVDDDVHASAMRHEDKCRLEVCLPNSEAIFYREAEVRDAGEHGIGLVIKEPLPGALVPSRDDMSISAANNDWKAALWRLRSFVAMLVRG